MTMHQAQTAAPEAATPHTPLPWSVGHPMEANYLYGADGSHIACISSAADCRGEDSFVPGESEACANAALIVRACNSHDELLSAAIYAVQQLADGDDPELDDDGDEIDPFERLRAAIARATGAA